MWADKNEILVVVVYELDGKLQSDLFTCKDFKNFLFEQTLINIEFNMR